MGCLTRRLPVLFFTVNTCGTEEGDVNAEKWQANCVDAGTGTGVQSTTGLAV